MEPGRPPLPRRHLAWALAALALCAAYEAIPETLTMTTYYPSPSGVYRKLVSTAQTLLARDGGNVGIGTSAPRSRLTVSGKAEMDASVHKPKDGDPAAWPAGFEGEMAYSAARKGLFLFDGTRWRGAMGSWEEVSLAGPAPFDVECLYKVEFGHAPQGRGYIHTVTPDMLCFGSSFIGICSASDYFIARTSKGTVQNPMLSVPTVLQSISRIWKKCG
jgi:hypothetical protein